MNTRATGSQCGRYPVRVVVLWSEIMAVRLVPCPPGMHAPTPKRLAPLADLNRKTEEMKGRQDTNWNSVERGLPGMKGMCFATTHGRAI